MVTTRARNFQPEWYLVNQHGGASINERFYCGIQNIPGRTIEEYTRSPVGYDDQSGAEFELTEAELRAWYAKKQQTKEQK